MKNKKKNTISIEEQMQFKRGNARRMKQEQGAMDGRFVTKVVKDKTKYNRKPKHKADENN